jgi:CheY-like chemotaxis protein
MAPEVSELVGRSDRPGAAMKGRILVVDDNVDIRQGLRDLLQHEGYAVECVADGAAGLLRLQEGFRPSAILLDLVMQGVGGEQFHAAQQAVPEFARIPVVVISADRCATARVVASGATAGLAKPFRFEELMLVLERVVPP